MKLWVKILVILILIVSVFVWLDQSRHFYCLSDKQCFTVWKRLGNKCYIIPGKYFGIFRPSHYIETTNNIYVDVIRRGDTSLLVNTGKNIEILDQSIHTQLIDWYGNDRVRNDSLYTFFDGKYRRYKKEVEYIGVNIEENYAVDKSGKKLK